MHHTPDTVQDTPPPPTPPSAEAAAWLDALPGAVVQTGADHRVSWANASARRLLGPLALPGTPLPFAANAATLDDGQPLVLPDGRRLVVRAGQPVDGVRLLQVEAAPEPVDNPWQIELATDLARLVFARHDRRNGRYHFNAEGSRLLGFTAGPEGVPATDVAARIHPEDKAAARRASEESLRERRPVDVDLRVADASGRWRHLLIRGITQTGAGGEPVAELSVALDVTLRREAEAAAHVLSARFDLAARTAGIGYWSREGDDERAYWSDQMRALHGLSADEPVPTLKEWRERFVHRDDLERVRGEFRLWLSGQAPNVKSELRVVRADGQVRHLMTHSLLQAAGDRPVLFGIVIDVTERRLADQALRRADERAALAARGAGIGTWEIDRRTGVIHWDAQMWQLRGLSPRPTPPSTAEMLEWVYPGDREAMREQMARASEADEIVEYQFRLHRPDGGVRWLASRSATVRDAQGLAERRIGVNWDVTDSRQAEAERRDREAAEQANRAKSRFLARMSHELRTPLNAVLGFTQLLRAREADATARDWLGHVESAGQHLLSLINDVLDLASLDTGDLRVDLSAVDLGRLIAETLPLLEPLREAQGITIDVELPPMRVWSDPVRLRQILLNLLSNALKYNRPDGRVTVEARVDGSHAVLSVADTGRGMSDAQLRDLFQPFNRLGIEREGIDGTGIGLTIVKALAARLGGTIQVSSQIDVGTRFDVHLPLTEAGTASSPAGEAPGGTLPTPQLTPQRGLLYIEDNQVNALIVQELLQRRPDIRLLHAVDARSGISLARDARPDLVLLDMHLPDDDGVAVLTALRADPKTAGIPVIMLSASLQADDQQRARGAGAIDFWTKPIDAAAFHRAIDTLFGQPAG
jgi:PAS domain S-box-containing protein